MDQPIRIDNANQSAAQCKLISVVDQYLVIYLRFIFFSKSTIVMTTDLKATNYVLVNNYDFIKDKLLRKISRRLFGNGAFCCINWGIP